MKRHFTFLFRSLVLTAVFLMSSTLAFAYEKPGLPGQSAIGHEFLFPKSNQAAPALKSFSANQENDLHTKIITQIWDEENQEWTNNLMREFTYINENMISEIIYNSFEGELTKPYEKEVRIYNEQWIQQETEYYRYNQNWVKDRKTLNHTNEYNDIILTAALRWNMNHSRWDTLDGVKTNYIYTEDGQYKEIHKYQRENTGWKPTFLEINIFNEEGQITQNIEKRWNSEAQEYVNMFRTDNFYNEDNVLVEVIFWNTDQYNEWIQAEKISQIVWYNYDKFIPESYIVVRVIYDPYPYWMNYIKVTLTYNEDTDLFLSAIRETYDEVNHEWKFDIKESMERDSNDNILLYTIESHSDEDWTLDYGFSYAYTWNQEGNLDTLTTQWYHNIFIGWENYYREIYIYKELSTVNTTDLASIETSRVKVFPNPASDKVGLRFSADADNVLVKIFNSSGQQVFIENIDIVWANQPVVIPTAHLRSGLYLLEISNGNDKTLHKLMINAH